MTGQYSGPVTAVATSGWPGHSPTYKKGILNFWHCLQIEYGTNNYQSMTKIVTCALAPLWWLWSECFTKCLSSVISVQSCSTSVVSKTSKVLRLVMSLVKAKTIRTLSRRCWTNSSWKKDPSIALALSPNNCCIPQNSWDDLRSPIARSSELKSCCNWCCSEAAVCFISCSFRKSYRTQWAVSKWGCGPQ